MSSRMTLRGRAMSMIAPRHTIHELKGPRVTSRHIQMAVHASGDKYISECIRQFGIWEPRETDFFLDTLMPGDTFVDIGANIGYFSVLAANIVGPSGSVVAFEPDPDNFRLLQLNFELNGYKNCKPVRAGVSDASGTARFFLSTENNRGDHRLWSDGKGPERCIDVPLRTLENGVINERTVIKIDVQGWEEKVILGNWNEIKKAKAVAFEYAPGWLLETGAEDPLSIVRKFVEAGHEMLCISEDQQVMQKITAEELVDVTEELKRVTSGINFIDLVAVRSPDN